MKVLDVISAFDKLRPNSFTYETKKAWLISVETDIRRFDVLHNGKAIDFDFVTNENPELFLDEYYMDLYVYYLVSMADMANGEYRLYNISSTYFNSLFDKWKRLHRSINNPHTDVCIKV